MNRVVVETSDFNTHLTHKPRDVEVEIIFLPNEDKEAPENKLYPMGESFPTPEAEEPDTQPALAPERVDAGRS